LLVNQVTFLIALLNWGGLRDKIPVLEYRINADAGQERATLFDNASPVQNLGVTRYLEERKAVPPIRAGR
jgi:hypothetical protein